VHRAAWGRRVSQEIKAIAISRGYVAAGWIDLFCVPPAS
jgi:stage V sporulation protein SpoVS